MRKAMIVGFGQQGKLFADVLVKNHGFKSDDLLIVDVRDDRLIEASGLYPESKWGKNIAEVFSAEVQYAFVASSTAAHFQNLVDLMNLGVKHIFCETPLVGDLNELTKAKEKMNECGANIFGGYLINFSSAVTKLVNFMLANNLIMLEGRSEWFKNRRNDKRPTYGNHDQFVHPVGVFDVVANINQKILKANVFGRISYLQYVDIAAQTKAHEMDANMPLPKDTSSSTFINMVCESDKRREIDISINTSYVSDGQTRKMVFVLGDILSEATHVAEINFDEKRAGIICDSLVVTRLLQEEIVFQDEACIDKVAAETDAFLRVLDGKIDPKLAGLNVVCSIQKIATAVIESSRTNKVINVKY